MEEENENLGAEQDYRFSRVVSPEIVEISEESLGTDRDRKDVYIAVGRDDVDVVKWALKNLLLPGGSVFLIHVFPSLDSIPTPIGKLSRNQVSRGQFQTYANEESLRRQNVLHKYIRLCSDSQVAVDTILIESNLTAKAIVDLIPVLNITKLVMGTKRPLSRKLRKGVAKSEYVRKNAPDFCEVTTICNGKSIEESQQISSTLNSFSPSSGDQRSKPQPHVTRLTDRNFFECVCFSGKFT